jgi:hypothetical protein
MNQTTSKSKWLNKISGRSIFTGSDLNDSGSFCSRYMQTDYNGHDETDEFQFFKNHKETCEEYRKQNGIGP